MSSSISTQLSPIFKLSYDILNEIFMVNTMADESESDYSDEEDSMLFSEWTPLTVSLSTSHVCRTWRNITVNSPILWGRLLDTNNFVLKTRSLWDEIVRRSHNSPIWLRCNNWEDDDTTGATTMDQEVVEWYVLPLLESHHKRIEQLELDLRVSRNLGRDARWTNLFELSNRIEILHVDVLHLSPYRILFESTLNVREILRSPMHSLEHLYLNGKFCANDVLRALENMPRLRALHIIGGDEESHPRNTLYSPVNPILLHFLEDIEFHGSFIGIMLLLSPISAPPGCRLVLGICDFSKDITSEGLTLLLLPKFTRALAGYIQDALGQSSGHAHMDIGMKVESRPWAFEIEIGHVYIDQSKLTRLCPPIFNFYVCGHQLPTWFPKAVLDAVFSCRAPGIGEFSFEWRHSSPLVDTFPRFIEFLHSLTGLKVLSADMGLIRAALATSDGTGTRARILPNLHLLKYEFNPENFDHQEAVSSLHQFLSWRQEMGIPIRRLLFGAGPLDYSFLGLFNQLQYPDLGLVEMDVDGSWGNGLRLL